MLVSDCIVKIERYLQKLELLIWIYHGGPWWIYDGYFDLLWLSPNRLTRISSGKSLKKAIFPIS